MSERKTGQAVPRRRPLYGFGQKLRDKHGFVGEVDVIYADYRSALDGNVVSEGWFEMQSIPPSTKDQIFYSLVGDGAVLAGEMDVEVA